jgi:triphosphoribosyl-dephospho-CoA synthase
MVDGAFQVQLSCLWEATARKAGNVHRFRDFVDASYLDFLVSAAAIAPVLSQAVGRPLGETILAAVRATRQVVTSNTNLGIILLLTPLAAVPNGDDLTHGVARVLAATDVEDARQVYAAIRLAAPGGLDHAEAQDVASEPTLSLREVMTLARERDLIARQYADDFAAVLSQGEPELKRGLQRLGSLEGAILWCQLRLLSVWGDSLIARKVGQAASDQARLLATEVLALGWPASDAGRAAFARLDAWLRADGNRRNPGAVADLVAASLFAALRRGTITLPLSIPWSVGEFDG